MPWFKLEVRGTGGLLNIYFVLKFEKKNPRSCNSRNFKSAELFWQPSEVQPKLFIAQLVVCCLTCIHTNFKLGCRRTCTANLNTILNSSLSFYELHFHNFTLCHVCLHINQNFKQWRQIHIAIRNPIPLMKPEWQQLCHTKDDMCSICHLHAIGFNLEFVIRSKFIPGLSWYPCFQLWQFC